MIRKKSDKTMWYKKSSSRDEDREQNTKKKKKHKADLRKIVTTFTVPRTHNRALAKALSKVEMDLRVIGKTKMRIVEKLGVTLKYQLVKSNP